MDELNDFQRLCLTKGASFVSWRVPGETVKTALDCRTEGTIAPTENCFAFAPFDPNRHTALFLDTQNQIEGWDVPADDLQKLHKHPRRKFSLPLPQAVVQKEDYIHQVQNAVRSIKAGQFEKVVLSHPHFMEGDYDLPYLFSRLCTAMPKAFVYLLNHPESGIWLGASPERLLKATSGKLQTLALAGTRLYGSASSWTDKEYDEQALVTRFIEKNLSASGCMDIRLKGPKMQRAGNVMHLATLIEASFPESMGIQNLVSQLHPSPAIGGVPRKPAVRYISEHEAYDRNYYTGWMGQMQSGKTDVKDIQMEDFDSADLYVNLRCLRMVRGGLELYAGGGITAASDPVAEWDETTNKLLSLGRYLITQRPLAELS